MTTLNFDFNQSDDDLTAYGWTSLPSGPYDPGFNIVSNKLQFGYNAPDNQRNIICRYDSDLASGNHYAKLTASVASHNTACIGVATRLSDSAMDGYVGAIQQNGSKLRIWRVDGGSFTEIASGTLTFPSFPFDIKLESIDDTHKLYIDDNEELIVVDDNHNSNKRCGVADGYNLSGWGVYWDGDDFEAADVGGGGGGGTSKILSRMVRMIR